MVKPSNLTYACHFGCHMTNPRNLNKNYKIIACSSINYSTHAQLSDQTISTNQIKPVSQKISIFKPEPDRGKIAQQKCSKIKR